MSPHNFGLASTRDNVLYTSERPGNESIEDSTMADQNEVNAWMEFMKEQKITCVIALLDENEYEAIYDEPGLPTMYQDNGFKWLIQPMGQKKSATTIFKYIREEEDAGGKVVLHCTGGTGRASRVAAAWLVHRYGITPNDAMAEVVRQGGALGVKRNGDPNLLQIWLDGSDA